MSYPLMNLDRCKTLIADLEHNPEQLPAYYGELESAIRWLMDTTFESKDPQEKTRLAATEMRARLNTVHLRITTDCRNEVCGCGTR